MASLPDLDRLLVTMDVAVQSFAVCEVKRGRRLISTPVDAIMVHYVLAGTMHMSIDGQTPVACGPGSIALIPPGIQPRLAADEGPSIDVDAAAHSMLRQGLLVFDAADGKPGDLRIVAGVVLASMSGSFGLLDKLTVPITEDLADLGIIPQAFQMMLDEIANPSIGGRALTSALMKTCLLLVIRRFFERPEADAALLGALADPRLGAAVAAVLEKPASPHTVATLAERAGMSRSSFARAFTDAFKMSPMEFVAKTRLRHAADMLRSSKLPIKVIAASIGFASRSHFSTAFREAYGMDPTAFRKEQGLAALDPPRPSNGPRERYALTLETDRAA